MAAARPHLADGQPWSLKIVSPDIVHKSEVGGRAAQSHHRAAVRKATEEILSRACAAIPKARITGVTVFPMIVRPKARELIVGVADDPHIRPHHRLWPGRYGAEVISDKAMNLPPLNLALATSVAMSISLLTPRCATIGPVHQGIILRH